MHMSSCLNILILRDAEVKRDEHVKDASKLVTRATKYKDEAKREQKKVLNMKIIRSLKIEFTIRWKKSGNRAWRKRLLKRGPWSRFLNDYIVIFSNKCFRSVRR